MLAGNFQARRAILRFQDGPIPFPQPGGHAASKLAILVYNQAGAHDYLYS